MVWVGRDLQDNLPTALPCTGTPSTRPVCSKSCPTPALDTSRDGASTGCPASHEPPSAHGLSYLKTLLGWLQQAQALMAPPCKGKKGSWSQHDETAGGERRTLLLFPAVTQP